MHRSSSVGCSIAHCCCGVMLVLLTRFVPGTRTWYQVHKNFKLAQRHYRYW
jgi:hypothetical protein